MARWFLAATERVRKTAHAKATERLVQDLARREKVGVWGHIVGWGKDSRISLPGKGLAHGAKSGAICVGICDVGN